MLSAVLAASLTMSGCGAFNKEANSAKNNTAKSSDSSVDPEKRVLEGDLVVKSENYSLNLPIASFLFNNYYQDNVEYASAYMGLDVTKSLKDQYYDAQNGISWYDYFMTSTKTYLRQLFVQCEAAHADGYTLDKEDNDKVEETLKSVREAAKEEGKQVSDYLVDRFGKNVTLDDFRAYLEMTAISMKYHDNVYAGFTYSDEDYEKYYESHKTEYQFADFLKFTFSYTTDSSDSEKTKDNKDKAKAYAEDLAKCKSTKAFLDYIKKFYKDNPSALPTSGSQSQTLDTDDLIQVQLDAAKTEKYAYEVSSETGKWLFDISREPLETKVFETESSYMVYMVTKVAYRDESHYRKVRHILVSPEKDSSGNMVTNGEVEAKKKADQIYEEWKKGKATEESFGELAKKYSDDPGSKSNGGYYGDVSSGMMVSEFDSWLFDSSRKVGDTGIIKTEYGYHIMYYCGEGEQIWKKSVDTMMRKNDYDKHYQEISQKYRVTIDDEYLNSIEVSEIIDSSSSESQASETSTKTEESKTESSKDEASKTESSKTESSKTESSKTESSKTESSKTESSKTESSKT